MDITSKKVMKVPNWCMKDPIPVKKFGFQATGILTSFDNTPRRDFETANLWSADVPDKVVERFYTSLYAAIYYETCCFPQETRKSDAEHDERFILINAMNEWAEGMALEPSDTFGRQLLQAIADAKENVLASNCTASRDNLVF
jgi:hypothetical protein